MKTTKRNPKGIDFFNKSIIMKNMKYYFAAILILAVLPVALSQDDYTKNLEKSYTASSINLLTVDNKYGDIDVRDWNKDEINIKVNIILHDISKQKADQVFKQVDINFNENSGQLTVETDYSDDFFKMMGRNYHTEDKKFEVNYVINMPASQKVDINNKYGDVFVSRINSASYIGVKYGNLQANQLIADGKDKMATIDIAYAKANIETCQWLKIDCKYSKVNIQTSKALIVLSKYSKLEINDGSSIVCESKYDTYNVGNLANFVTEAEYSNFRMDEVSRKISLETRYTDVRVTKVPEQFESIDIDNSYGSIRIGIDKDASYYLKGHARYAKITFPDNQHVNYFQENTEMNVNGNIGEKKNNVPEVNVETKYGGVNLTQ